jgi:hypothetical protein
VVTISLSRPGLLGRLFSMGQAAESRRDACDGFAYE